MNRNLLVAFFFCLAIGKSFGQITLGTADFSHANETYRVSILNPYPGLDFTTTGANVTWDFSGLLAQFISQPGQQTVDTFLSVSTLPTFIAGYFSFLKPC